MKQYLIQHNAPRPEQEKAEIRTMPFGKFKGWRFEDVPESYLIKVSDDFDRDRPGVMPDQRFSFRVPLEVRERAREELKRRGWRKKGQRWEFGKCFM